MSARKRKTPTKTELIQLQKLYKTDEKIGERLGGVPPYLVAYWRRKKNVPKHSLPKFSEKEIRDLWERFGDDDKCGLEMGISKAAFYNWRRRYGIKEKPAFLKLEQLELNFPGLKLHTTSTSLYGKQTIAQKIIAQKCDREKIDVGNILEIEPDMVISNFRTYSILEEFKKMTTEYVWNPNKITISLANCYYDNLGLNPVTHKKIREFIKRQGIKNFYELSDGTCHQVAIEKGQILPGQFVVGSDKYSLSLGCLSAMAINIDDHLMVKAWSDGKIKVEVPHTIRIDINGRRSRGVYGKDIALLVLKQLATVKVENKVIEFYGNVISHMNISERFTLCNMMIDIGAKSSICPFDSVTRRYLSGRTLSHYNPVIADKNAEYNEMYQINIDHLTPQIGCINSVDDIKPISNHDGIPINVIILGTGNNGRFDDLRIAAEILKGKQVNPDCRLIVYPSSRSVYLESLKKGLIRVLVESGAVVMYPGYSHCTGDEQTLLAPGEKALATTNFSLIENLRNEKHDIFICSPATAAASALNGAITDPTRFVK